MVLVAFFFSSRRRHTRFDCDWSSDVCSSDLANTASATPPTTVQMPGDYSQSFSGPDSPCGFDITFSAAGAVTVTTYYDNAGLPIRESVHGSLSHTVSSAWHTLFSKGPAPVHIDLT